MNVMVRAIAAIAISAAAVPASAFVRETTTPGHPDTGLCLWWRDRQITYHVNATRASPQPCQSAATAEAAAVQALSAWGGATRTGEAAACTDFRFVHGAASATTAIGDDGQNLIVFRSALCSDVVGLDPCAAKPGACAAKFNCWEHDVGTIALTTTSFDSGTGEISDADIELFGWDGQQPPVGFYFTCVDSPQCSGVPFGQSGCASTDVQAVVTHEAGHMLGLDHVCAANSPVVAYQQCTDPAAVMKPTVGSVSQRALAQDDVTGVCTLYPLGGQTPTCLPDGKVPAKKAASSGGCSAGGGAGLGGALLAAAALAWRGRRRRSGR